MDIYDRIRRLNEKPAFTLAINAEVKRYACFRGVWSVVFDMDWVEASRIGPVIGVPSLRRPTVAACCTSYEKQSRYLTYMTWYLDDSAMQLRIVTSIIGLYVASKQLAGYDWCTVHWLLNNHGWFHRARTQKAGEKIFNIEKYDWEHWSTGCVVQGIIIVTQWIKTYYSSSIVQLYRFRNLTGDACTIEDLW